MNRFPILNALRNAETVNLHGEVSDHLVRVAYESDLSLWDIQNVANWFVSEHAATYRPGDFPCKPPFGNIWTAFRMPVYRLSGEDEITEWHCEVFCATEGNTVQMLVMFQDSHRKGPAPIPFYAQLQLDEDGIITDSAYYPDDIPQEEFELTRPMYERVTSVALCAFTFSHCKNVSLEERYPKRHEQREAKRRGEPVLKYHEIVIDPHKVQQPSTGANRTDDHPQRALHIARGHFAHYTEDRPLFGKYVGTFWRPAHVRGSAEVGTVKSTYKVKP